MGIFNLGGLSVQSIKKAVDKKLTDIKKENIEKKAFRKIVENKKKIAVRQAIAEEEIKQAKKRAKEHVRKKYNPQKTIKSDQATIKKSNKQFEDLFNRL